MWTIMQSDCIIVHIVGNALRISSLTKENSSKSLIFNQDLLTDDRIP